MGALARKDELCAEIQEVQSQLALRTENQVLNKITQPLVRSQNQNHFPGENRSMKHSTFHLVLSIFGASSKPLHSTETFTFSPCRFQKTHKQKLQFPKSIKEAFLIYCFITLEKKRMGRGEATLLDLK